LQGRANNGSAVKLSQILESRSIQPEDEDDGNGSWGIFISPENSNDVVKLFVNEQQFNNEKKGYDKVLGEPDLKEFANQYSTINIEFDTSNYPIQRKKPPIESALLIPFLSNPPWEIIGKLGDKETDGKLVSINVDVKRVKDKFYRIGLLPCEITFFVHSTLRNIKAIDFTYSEVVSNNYSDKDESHT
jgi:hypothetical protein